MARRRYKRKLCGADIGGGNKCRNYHDTCPHHQELEARKEEPFSSTQTSTVTTSNLGLQNTNTRAARVWLSDNQASMQSLVKKSQQQFGISPDRIIKDYWLIATLQRIYRMLGANGRIPPLYGSKTEIGNIVFGGGTSLSAAWDIVPRYSEDIDLVLIPAPNAKSKHLRNGLQFFRNMAAKLIPYSVLIKDRNDGHKAKQSFFTLQLKGGINISVDVTVRDFKDSPVHIEQKQPISLVGRVSSVEERNCYTELGGHIDTSPNGASWIVPCLGPCSTAMDKLLAQTHLSDVCDVSGISSRARDVYDLAMVSANAHKFEGHIGRDSLSLLAAAERIRSRADGAVRPKNGFSSIASFKRGSSQYEALKAGYETVLEEMVWGEKIGLDEAIELATTLDPIP